MSFGWCISAVCRSMGWGMANNGASQRLHLTKSLFDPNKALTATDKQRLGAASAREKKRRDFWKGFALRHPAVVVVQEKEGE